MSLNSFIISTLKPLGVPVEFQTYDGSNTTYITFFEYNQNGALHGDDKELKTAYYVQVDVWSEDNYTEIVKKVRETMIKAGFIRTFETEVYEEETKTFHKVFRFQFVQ